MGLNFDDYPGFKVKNNSFQLIWAPLYIFFCLQESGKWDVSEKADSDVAVSMQTLKATLKQSIIHPIKLVSRLSVTLNKDSKINMY